MSERNILPRRQLQQTYPLHVVSLNRDVCVTFGEPYVAADRGPVLSRAQHDSQWGDQANNIALPRRLTPGLYRRWKLRTPEGTEQSFTKGYFHWETASPYNLRG